MLRRSLIFVGAVVVVFAVLAGAFNLLALGARHTFAARSSYTGVRSLVLGSGDGDVHLTGAPSGSPVHVVAHVTESFAAPRRRALRPAAGALRLSYSCPGGIPGCSVSYDVAVPAGVSLTVSAGDGTVDATGLNASHVSLESGNGNVSAVLSEPAASLRASSGNGTVTLVVPDVSYVVHASSGSGNVSERSLKFATHSTHRIDASSGNGDVTITAAR
jgi:Toastrack DUF4097